MLNYIWSALLVIGIIVGLLTGRADMISKAMMEASSEAVKFSIALLGIICLWSGLVGIIDKTGLIKVVARWFAPILRILFPGIPKDHPAQIAILMNLTANFFGLGNAATPLGIEAMKSMQTLNENKTVASDSMIMFIVLNGSALQLIPSTVIALRYAAGAQSPASIVVPVWIASLCASVTGFLAVFFMSKK